MATLHHNISGELTQELLAPGDNAKVSSISLTNARGLLSAVPLNYHTCKVDLYIEKKLTGKFYILKGVSLPLGATLSHDFTMNNSTDEYGLYIKLTNGDAFELTGSINPGNSTTTVPGSGTTFTTELDVGSDIVVTGETRRITAIASTTSLTISKTFTDDIATDSTPDGKLGAEVDVIIS